MLVDKKLVLIILAFFISLQAQFPKILIFSERGGKGHAMAIQALREHFDDHFSYTIVDAISVVCPKEIDFDPLHADYVDHIRQEDFDPINRSIAQEYARIKNAYKTKFLKKKRFKGLSREASLIKKVIQNEQPDLVLSVATCLNGFIADAAQNLDLPFVVVTLDATYLAFESGLELFNYKKFRLIVPFEASDAFPYRYIYPNLRDQVLTWGLPLRRALTDDFDVQAFKEKWHFAQDRPNILLMMGGLGSQALLRYVKEFSEMENSYHVFVFIGAYESLRADLAPFIKKSKNTTFEIVPFTLELPHFLRTADLAITKPGGLTCGEILVTGIPTLFDATKNMLLWEKTNMEEVVRCNAGKEFKDISQLDETIQEYLRNPLERDLTFRKNHDVFGGRLIDLCYSLMQENDRF